VAVQRLLILSFGAFTVLLCAGCLKLGESSELRLAPEPTSVPFDRISCLEIFGTAFRSEAEQSWYNENCNKWPLVKVASEAPAAPGAPAAPISEPPECASIRGKPYESSQQRNFYLQNCNGQPAQAGLTSAQPGQPPQTQQQTAGGSDRTDCNAIRGTPYRSNSERTWYIQNCGQTTSAPPVTAGPDRTDCNAIRGTSYRSDNERNWYNANCQGG
jgi:hypothetical protein